MSPWGVGPDRWGRRRFDFLIADEHPAVYPVTLDAVRRAAALRQDETAFLVQLAGIRWLMWVRVTRRALYGLTLAATDRLVIDTRTGSLNDAAPRLNTAPPCSTPE